MDRAAVEDALRRAYLAGEGLRREDTQKVCELVPLLEELARVLPRRERGFTLVDACAGKSALGVLAAALLLEPRGGTWRVVALERDARHRPRAERAAGLLGVKDSVVWIHTDVDEEAAWPAAPDVVVALHACGQASDAVLDRAMSSCAQRILLVPCCYGGGPRHDGAAGQVPAQPAADAWARTLPMPRHGLVGRRFAAAIIDAERTLRLEAAGYETEVVELFSPSVSPHNLLWRARRVGEPTRMAAARRRHAALLEQRILTEP